MWDTRFGCGVEAKTIQRLCVFLTCLFCGCESDAPGASPPEPESSEVVSPAPVTVKPALLPSPKKKASCLAELEAIEVTERHWELGAYYEALPEIVLTTKVSPVIYLDVPAPITSTKAKETLDRIRKANQPRREIRKLLRENANNKDFLRRLFLRQSYLFSADARLANAMVKELKLHRLFDDPRIYLHRGDKTHILTLEEEEYVGADKMPAKILLGDRVSNDRMDLITPLHLDFGVVRKKTGAVRTRLVATGTDTAWVELQFPDGNKHPAKVQLIDGKTEVVCVADDTQTAQSLRLYYSKFWWNQRQISATADLMIGERLLFDEPKDEEEGVQEDGDLRLEWHKAYHRGNRMFFLREVEYRVFDGKGNPTPPQVCIDFIFDVLERSSGNWYKKRSEKPGRTAGTMDFRAFAGMNRRSVYSVIATALDETLPVSRYDVPRQDWIALRKRFLFAERLAGHADRIQEGDILIIHGLREQDMREHFHAVLVLHTDPVTGLPMVVADNQGRPRIGSLHQAMQAAPLRSVKYVIRVDVPEMELYTKAWRRAQAAEDAPAEELIKPPDPVAL